MSDDHLLRRTEAHFELLARETVRLGLNTNETRMAFFQQQREFLLTSLSGARSLTGPPARPGLTFPPLFALFLYPAVAAFCPNVPTPLLISRHI
jgi:hypothetical protein